MRLRFVLVGIILGACLFGAVACTGPGLPAMFGPSSCGAGADRCAGLNCPQGTHCTLTSNCAAFCEQEQLTKH